MILNAMFCFQSKKQMKEEEEKISKMTEKERISYFLEKSKEQAAHTQKMRELSRKKAIVRQYYNSNDFINNEYERIRNNEYTKEQKHINLPILSGAELSLLKDMDKLKKEILNSIKTKDDLINTLYGGNIDFENERKKQRSICKKCKSILPNELLKAKPVQKLIYIMQQYKKQNLFFN